MLLSYVRIIYQVMAIIKSKYRQQLDEVETRNKSKFKQKRFGEKKLVDLGV